jgi:hypothetical protein
VAPRAVLGVLETRNILLVEGIDYRGITSIQSRLFFIMNFSARFSWFYGPPTCHVITDATYNIAASYARTP